MKKRLKGLVCLWLALVMLIGMMPTAMATEPTTVDVVVYTGTKALKDGDAPESWEFGELAVGTKLIEQSNLMTIINNSHPEGKVINGWKLWGTVSGGVYDYAPPKEYDRDGYIAQDDDVYSDTVLEPLWLLKYQINPQPTNEEPTVGVEELSDIGSGWVDITDNSNVSYQWYEYGENTYRVVDAEDAPASDEIDITDGYCGVYDSVSRTWATDDFNSSIDISIPVKAGDIVRVTPVEGTASGEITVSEWYGDAFAENDGIYTMEMKEDKDNFNLYVFVGDDNNTGSGEFTIEIIRVCSGDAVTDQTTNTLTSGTDGQQYVCKAVIEDDCELVPLTSDPVTYSTPLHTHDWTGAWSSDDTYHWRECANDGCDVVETAEKGEYGIHDFTNGTCICGKSAPKPTRPSGGGGSPVSVYKVTFETNGAEDEIDAQHIRRDKKVQKPETPVKEGYVFDGWYIDEALTEAYDFDAWVKKNFTLYAKWTQAATSDDDNNSSDVGAAKKWNPFIDVGIGDWFHDNVKYVFENEYMNGVSTREFMPSQFVTRGMLVTILHRLDGEPKAENAATFEDVAADAYYAEAVAWAQEKAIVNGVTETEFAPEAKITREQLAAILYRYASLKGYDVSVGESTNILSYEDVDEISEYAVPALQYAVGAGIIKGKTESTLNPQESATRAEIATIIQRFVKANKI